MPRQVDHDERRREIAEAVWRIAAARGLEAVRMREVAAEAGVSIGRVQHYFESKDDLVAFAATRLRNRIEERIRRHVAEVPEPRSPLLVLRALLTALLPLDEDGRETALVGLAVFHRALGDRELARLYRRGRARLVAEVMSHLAAAAAAGEIPERIDPYLETYALLAATDGIATDLLHAHYPPETALALLDRQIDGLRGAPPPVHKPGVPAPPGTAPIAP
ncbi:TetR/AcrR family transcriptional regulator [Marinactinospora rubrisoli]|uniref:TetR/AcrR family transcriptional regulator n=1 Tax=Marinactinospora rubrisoli TaxID=2715399 RepID=A0ABW2KKX5_9ACTN